jgi:hypothetical protein
MAAASGAGAGERTNQATLHFGIIESHDGRSVKWVSVIIERIHGQLFRERDPAVGLRHTSRVDITKTKHGLRLSQHGVVISELRLTPGPTHSVFDVLAALVAQFQSRSRIGMMGFAGGGMMAPLAALGVEECLDVVDLDQAGYDLFRRHCPEWAKRVKWNHADAGVWLKRQRQYFGVLLDDLSVPVAGDVVKPALCWTTLPALMQQRLSRTGIAIFNLLPLPGNRWNPELAQLRAQFPNVRVIYLDDFVNRVLVAGWDIPAPRELGRTLRQALRVMGSRQAERLRIRNC